MELLGTRSRKADDVRSPGALLSRGLGWFSIGLGVAEVTAPRMLARAIGIHPGGRTPVTMRAMGAREILNGLGILARPQRPLPLWSRVLGDALDLALLGWAVKAKRTNKERLTAAIVSVLGVTVLDIVAGASVQRAHKKAISPVTRTITINRPPSEVYAVWRDLEQLPRFMEYLESVVERDNMRSHWVAKLPVGGSIEWDAEIIEDRPSELIAWRSVRGSKFPNSGRVTFKPALDGVGCEIRVEMQAFAPGTALGAQLAKFFAGPQIEGDLRRLKQIVETGEVVHSDASIHRGMHPAQPSEKGLEL